MVYVDSDGNVHESQPWSLKKIYGILTGITNMIFYFFQTLIPIESAPSNNNFGNSSGRQTRGGNGGGSGGRFGYGGPGRPGGNIRGLGSLPPPSTPTCGSCCGR